jgi:hypothetical protein
VLRFPHASSVSRGLLLGLLGSAIAISANAGVISTVGGQTMTVSYSPRDLRNGATDLYGRLR